MRSTAVRLATFLALALVAPAGLAAQTKPAAPAARTAAPADLGTGLYATFNTSLGTFVAQLFPNDAPKSVANFVALAQGKRPFKDPVSGSLSSARLYDGLLFFRTVPGYIIQVGDPLNNGTGNLGYTIPWEKNSLKFDRPGRMSLAQIDGDPTSRGPQIFFTIKAVPQLDKDGFLIIGQVVEGMDVVTALAEGPRRGGQSDTPAHPNLLTSVTIKTVK